MKRLVGGDYLLDLTPIDIEESVDVETYTNITNTEVIAQLTNLKKYVSNPSMIKPVWVKLKNGETDELVVARGEFKVVDDGEFEIVIQLDGYKLKIHVEFTQALNENNDPIDDWYIGTNDAKYLFTSDTQNIGTIIGTGELDNAKPIYLHPLRFYRDAGDIRFAITMMIFNNSPLAFSKQSFKTWLTNLVDTIENSAIIMCSGYYKDTNQEITSLSNMYMLYNENHSCGFNGGKYNTLGVQTVDLTFVWDTVFDSNVQFYDGVNKIN